MENTYLGRGGPGEHLRVGLMPVTPSDIIGLASGFDKTDLPVNGLRHTPQTSSSGWYIWSSEAFPAVFEPVHAAHLLEQLPELRAYLSLPAGWRFMVAPDYDDIWQDDSLLEV